MNILLLNVNIGAPWAWGGIESHSLTLAALLTKLGHKVTMGCYRDISVRIKKDLELPSIRVRIRNSGDITAIMKIIRLCRRSDIHVIIANNGREYWPAAIAARLLNKKVVFVRHQTDRIRRTTRWLINNYVDRVVAASNAIRDALTGSGVNPGKVEVIFNAISLDRFNPQAVDSSAARKEFGISNRDIVIGTVGKLHEGKGVFELLRAVNRLAPAYPSLRLVFVGDGPARGQLEAEMHRLSLDQKVIFTGVRQDVERMYAAMDFFVLPSTCDEGFGMVLIEAMAMGKPVIGTKIGGIPNIIKDGVNGILVPAGDENALADALSGLIADKALSRSLSLQGRKMVEEMFSEHVMESCFRHLLNRVV